MTADDEVEQHYTPSQVAELFVVTEETVRNWIKDGTLAGVKIGERWRIPKSALVALGNKKFGQE